MQDMRQCLRRNQKHGLLQSQVIRRTDNHDLLFFEVSVVEYRAFGLRKSHTAGLALEHLVAPGIEAFFDDGARVSLSVVRTIWIQTYLVF